MSLPLLVYVIYDCINMRNVKSYCLLMPLILNTAVERKKRYCIKCADNLNPIIIILFVIVAFVVMIIAINIIIQN